MAEVDFHAGARREEREALEWYAEVNIALAEALHRQLRSVIVAISKNPTRYGWYDDTCREAPVKKFPYSIIYRIAANDRVQIIAIAHAKRKPGYWRTRVDS